MAFLGAVGQQAGLMASPATLPSAPPHGLVRGDKRLHVDYRISGILQPG